MLTVTIDTKQFDALAAQFPKLIDQTALNTANYGLGLIQRSTPVVTGAARQSWIVRKIKDFTYQIVSSVGRGAVYTPYLEDGTRKHIIGKTSNRQVVSAVAAKKLRRFMGKDGRVRFIGLHPGSKKHKGKIVEINKPKIAAQFGIIFNKLLEQITRGVK